MTLLELIDKLGQLAEIYGGGATVDILLHVNKSNAPVEMWMHDCNALCYSGLKLWVKNCPHCGMPRPTD